MLKIIMDGRMHQPYSVVGLQSITMDQGGVSKILSGPLEFEIHGCGLAFLPIYQRKENIIFL